MERDGAREPNDEVSAGENQRIAEMQVLARQHPGATW